MTVDELINYLEFYRNSEVTKGSSDVVLQEYMGSSSIGNEVDIFSISTYYSGTTSHEGNVVCLWFEKEI